MPANHLRAEGRKPRARWRPAVIATSGLIALIAGAAAGFAYSRPVTVAAPGGLHYSQSGHLAYSANVSPNSVYGADKVTTGEPMYGAVVSAFTLRYSYRFETSARASLSGTEQLVATINNGEGLVRTISLQPVTNFTGDQFQAAVTVDLATLTNVAKAFDHVGSSTGAGSYSLAIIPSVTVHGHVGSMPVNTSLDNPVNLNLNATGVFPPSTSALGSPTPGVSTSSRPFSVASSGTVAVPALASNARLWHEPVSVVRKLALAILLAALIVAGFAALSLLRDARAEDEAVRIATRYASMLVEVRSLPSSLEVVIVPLSSFDDLVEVARRLEAPILHEAGISDSYGVIDNGVLYAYLPIPRQAVAPPAEHARTASPGIDQLA